MSRYRRSAVEEAAEAFRNLLEWPTWRFGVGRVAMGVAFIGYVSCLAVAFVRTDGLVTLRDALIEALINLPYALVALPAGWLVLSLVLAFVFFLICLGVNVFEGKEGPSRGSRR